MKNNLIFFFVLLFVTFKVVFSQSVWEWKSPLPTGNTLRCVVYGKDQFIAVGDFGTILSSKDGISWDIRSSHTTKSLFSIIYADTMFIAIGDSGTIITSIDGNTWEKRCSNDDFQLKSLTYGYLSSEKKGLFVGVGDYGRIITSPDGISWKMAESITPRNFNSVTYGNNLRDSVSDKFVAVGDAGIIFTSSDGLNWHSENSPTTKNLNSITFSKDKLVVVGDLCAFLTSTDGTVWTSFPANQNIYNDCFNSVQYAKDLFVTVGEAICTSNDGSDWSFKNSPSKYPFNSVCYGANKYVAVGYSGTIITSTDAIIWSKSSTSSTDGIFRAVSFKNNQFFIRGGNSNKVYSSKDGTTWIQRDSSSDSLYNFTSIAFGNGQYVGIDYNNQAYSSKDKINWAKISLPTGNYNFKEVIFSNDNFILSGNPIVLTPDCKYFRFLNPHGNSVIFANNLYVSIDDMGYVSSSPDGENWTKHFTGFNCALYDIAYGDSQFVVVGDIGTIISSRDLSNWKNEFSQLSVPILSVAFGNNMFMVVTNDPDCYYGESTYILSSKSDAVGINFTSRLNRQTTNRITVKMEHAPISVIFPVAKSNSQVKIDLFSINGKKVYSVVANVKNGNVKIPAHTFQAGRYLLIAEDINKSLYKSYVTIW